MTVELTPEAEEDLSAIYHWYSDKGLGVADEFLRAFVACAASIERFPESYPEVHRHFRRAVLRRFPDNVFYVPTGRTVYIHAIFHSKMHPHAWRRDP